MKILFMGIVILGAMMPRMLQDKRIVSHSSLNKSLVSMKSLRKVYVEGLCV